MMRRLRRQTGATISDTAEVAFMPGKRLLLEDASTQPGYGSTAINGGRFRSVRGTKDESDMSEVRKR